MLWYFPEKSRHVFSARVLTNEQAASLRSLVGHLTFCLCQFGWEQKHAVGVKARSNTLWKAQRFTKYTQQKKQKQKHQNHSNHFRGNTFTRAACEQQPGKTNKRKKETETRHLVRKFCISEEPFLKKGWIQEEFAPGFEKQSFAVVLQKKLRSKFVGKKNKKQEAFSVTAFYCMRHIWNSSALQDVLLSFASSFSFPLFSMQTLLEWIMIIWTFNYTILIGALNKPAVLNRNPTVEPTGHIKYVDKLCDFQTGSYLSSEMRPWTNRHPQGATQAGATELTRGGCRLQVLFASNNVQAQ